MKIFNKAIAVISIAAAIVVAIMSIAAYMFTATSLERAISDRQLIFADQTMEQIVRLLYERQNDIKTVAGEEDLEVLLATGVVHKSLAFRLEQLLLDTGPWDDITVTGLDGAVATTTEPEYVGTNVLGDDGYRDALAHALRGEVYVSDAILQPGEDPKMLFAAPIRANAATGRPIVGLATAHLAWPAILEILQNAPVHTVELFNHDGVEIADGDFDQSGEGDPTDKTLDAAGQATVRYAATHSAASAVLATTDEGSTPGTMALVSFVHQEDYLSLKERGWLLIAGTPVSEAFASARQASLIAPGLFIPIVIIVVTVVLLLLHRWIIRPVLVLTGVAEAFGRSDLKVRAAVNGNDEIALLGSSFNRMAETLEGLYTNLERKVKQRTTQLAEKVKIVESDRARDEAILVSIGEGMVTVERDGSIGKMNRLAEDMLHMPPDSLGASASERVVLFNQDEPAPVPRGEHPANITLTEGRAVEGTYEVRYADEGKRLVAILSTPILQNDEVSGAVMIARDVTKEREVDRMKTEFISLASHQLRTPLSAIRWFTEMLMNGDAGEMNAEQADFTKSIYASAERMIDLVNALLNISRIESGRIIIDPKPTDLKELLDGIVADLHTKLEEKGHQLTVSVHPELGKINLDPRLIGQVYLNLLSNAIKYTPKKGEILVLVSRKNGDVVSQITDNGMGIPRDQQGSLFQKFFRGENVTKVETDGTGLGLYLVKAVVESSGGKIWFTSKENEGTTFWFSLPMSGMKPKAGEVTLDS